MEKITVQTNINAPLDKVWRFYTEPKHVKHWNNASPDWHTPKAENDLRVGGKFVYRMEARDGSEGFDFSGVYQEVKNHSTIAYVMEDGRKAKTTFQEINGKTKVIVVFDAESINSVELQRAGWQAILDNFKKYTESN